MSPPAAPVQSRKLTKPSGGAKKEPKKPTGRKVAKSKKEKALKQAKAAQLPRVEPRAEPGQGSPEHEAMDISGQDLILHDWSTSLSTQVPSYPEEELLDEIGRYFTAISKEPSRARSRRTAAGAHGPKLKRLSMQGAGGSLKGGKAAHRSPDRLKVVADPKLCHSQDSIDGLLPPLQVNQVQHHDGQVVSQPLEDTTGVKLPDSPELFVTKSKTRLSIMDVDLGSRPGSTTQVPKAVSEPMETSVPSSPSNPSAPTSPLRTSLLLETKEEGDKETK